MTRLSRLAVALACLVLASTSGFPVERPAAGHGAFFVDDVGQLNFFLVDFDGDFLQAIFPGDPGDFARQAPDGRQYMHAEAAEASLFVALTSGATFHGSGTFQLSMFVECTVFDPAGHSFTCFFPGPQGIRSPSQRIWPPSTSSSRRQEAPHSTSRTSCRTTSKSRRELTRRGKDFSGDPIILVIGVPGTRQGCRVDCAWSGRTVG
jgi:hypothetical protein